LGNTLITEEYKPWERGLDIVRIDKVLAILEITIAKEVSEEERGLAGF